MATLVNTKLTLTDLANTLDPDGSPAVVAEVLTKTNRILEDAPWMEANGPTTHTVTRRGNLPTGSLRALNEGVALSKSVTTQAQEVMQMREALSDTDIKLAEISGNVNQFRMINAKGHIMGMGQQLATDIIYGNSATTPKQMTGLMPRVNSLNDYVISCGGTGGGSVYTSIYAVNWGMGMANMIYPKGSPTFGIEHTDEGMVWTEDAASAKIKVFRDYFKAHGGFVLEDQRCLGRVCNIVTTIGAANSFNEDKLIELLWNMEVVGDTSGLVLYANRRIMTQAQIALKDKANVTNWAITEGLSGRPVLTFGGHPVKLVDAILNTEAEVV